MIVGPTASGKSELAVALAKKINGEIISADSRQVYRGMDIGTGKVEGAWRPKIKNPKVFIYKNISHHCIDFVSPKRQYSVAKFKQCADAAIRGIANRGKIPILCGGTGFWIDAVAYDMRLPEVPPNAKLRKKLARKTAKELLAILKKLDPKRAKNIEQKNPRRLIRAIEIARALGKVPELKKQQRYDTLWLGIKKPREELRHLIGIRLRKRLKQGMVQERKKLLTKGVSHRRLQELGLEYKFVSLYLQGKLQKLQMIQMLQRAIEQYARRQETWFKRNKKIYWIQNKKDAERLVKIFFKSS
ncbi:tRNA (adenosine(37)-N6)-dimethylallyltransferase MiaA, partial [Patescibacteria group bacterium]|nr:tRNA (adenosine(37)-N6)-dimethylallyltransferase MiaA [Patescibacteria group bacterium]